MTFAAIAAWILLVESGRRLPYLITPESVDIRIFVIFPVLMGALVVFGFFIRWKETGLTGFEQRVRSIASRRKRVLLALAVVAGLAFVSGTLAASSIYVIAWLARIAPGEQVNDTYRIYDVMPASWGWRLTLTKRGGGEFALFVPRTSASTLLNARVLCLHGHRSFFGTRVEALDAASCTEDHRQE